MAGIVTKLALELRAVKEDDIKNQSESDKKWLLFNYPPGLRLIHYDTTDVVEPILGVVKKLHY